MITLKTLRCFTLSLALSILLFSAAGAPAAEAAEAPNPGWEALSNSYPTNLPSGGSGAIEVQVLNIGAAESAGQVTVTDVLPAGVTATAAGELVQSFTQSSIGEEFWHCTIVPGTAVPTNSVVTCHNDPINLPTISGGAGTYTSTEPEGLNRQPRIGLDIAIADNAPKGQQSNHVTISGGGALASIEVHDPLTIGAAAPGFGFARWSGWFSSRDGTIDTQAASVPYSFTSSFELNLLIEEGTGEFVSAGGGRHGGEPRDFVVHLPPGLVGNPTGVPECTREELGTTHCPPGSIVGVTRVQTSSGLNLPLQTFNMVPPAGVPAEIAFPFENINDFIHPAIRTGSDYGIDANVKNAVQKEPIVVTTTLWGVPDDPSHNSWRGQADGGCTPEQLEPRTGNFGGECYLGPHPALAAFLRLPTSCWGPQPFSIWANTWLDPTVTAAATFLSPGLDGQPSGFTGCGQLPFEPTISSKLTTPLADSPTGLQFDLHIPQPEVVVPQSIEGLSIDEIQRIDLAARAGDFRIGLGGVFTPNLAFNVSAEEMQVALEALPSVGVGNVSVALSPAQGTHFIITFGGTLEATDVEQVSVVAGAPPLNGQVLASTVVNGTNSETVGAEPELHEADLKNAAVALPPGLVVNPASANGLAACSSAQIGLTSAPGVTPITTTPGPATCPDAAKIGSVEVDTPLLDHPIQGGVYVATPQQNPFGSLLAIYIAVNDVQTGTVIKLAGKVDANPVTGQLTATFANNPQLPFEDFHLNFFGGPTAALRTPQACGSFQTTSTITPWSSPEGADAHPGDTLAISQGAAGGACPAAPPNAPSFEAGTLTPKAGAFSPFVLRLARADGTQEIGSIDTTLPEGLLGKLAGISECSDAQIAQAASRTGLGQGKEEQSSPSCPLGSEVGTVNVGAGAGPDPYYVTGHAYLSGPYKGAPLSLAIIIPAVAGPYDFGNVMVRTALYLNPETAQIHAVSDELPHILQGIPLDVRTINLDMSRNDFTLNPTSCDKKTILASVTSLLNQSAPLSAPFQVGDCHKLGFAPKLKIKLKGGTKRHTFPSLKATVTYPKKGAYANIAKASVALPHSEFLEQGHIATICTRVQFAQGNVPGEKCPKASIYGFARATTPLLDKAVEGPVYLRSSSHNLPDLVAALNGQINVDLVGRIDTDKEDGIRNTFDLVPDAPVSKFTLSMKGGSKGLLVNSEDICRKAQKASVKFTAQNGKVDDYRSLIENDCGGKGRKHKKGHGKRHH